MSRFTRDMSMMIAGLSLGAVLMGGAAAVGITAEPSWSPIYVDGKCYKDLPLTVGDGSGLMIYPSGIEYTVVSSNPSIVTVEKVLGEYWKANAVSPGTATVTATVPDGRTGSVEIKVVKGT